MGLFKEDVFPELGRAGGFLDQGGGSSGVIGVQRSQIFIEQGAFRRFSEARRAASRKRLCARG